MTRSTLIGRVAWVQTFVTLCALGVVVAATWVAVSWMLARQTDRVLGDLLSRTLTYLEAGSVGEQVDWHWLAGEIDESRPSDVHFQVRERVSSRVVVELGGKPPLGRFTEGCRDEGGARICARTSARWVAIATRDRRADLAVRRQLMLALALASLAALAAVASASIAVTRRAIRPLSDLADRMAAVEPGRGALEPRATLRELARLERSFVELVVRFDQALEREKQLTAHASHELRTPLTVARAEVEALPNNEAALSALSRLESLIQVMLWFARAQTPLHGEDMEIVNLADVVAQQLAELRASAGARKLSHQLPDEALVRGDEQLLGRATWNLLDNAIKHGDGSGIEVALRCEANQLALRVRNRGPTIAARLREQIFVPYVRGTNSGTGFGLGLPFARAVARAHGGDVALEDDAASYTTLCMRLPLVGWHDAQVD